MRFSLRTMLLFFLLIALGLTGFRLICDYLDPFRGTEFDQSIWLAQAGKIQADSPRAAMFADLKINWLHLGMRDADVIQLLGEPDVAKSPREYQYLLGAWSGFRIDYDVLYLHFNAAHKLTKVEHLQH